MKIVTRMKKVENEKKNYSLPHQLQNLPRPTKQSPPPPLNLDFNVSTHHVSLTDHAEIWNL
jgi:hypothetical protein